MSTVLAVAYGGGHISAVLPVIRLLQSQSVPVEVLALTTAAAACAAAGVTCRSFRDFPAVHDQRSTAHGERLTAGATAHPAVPLAESIAYLGANYRDLENQHGVAGAAERFAQQGRQAFLPVATMERILSELRPAVVLTTSAPRAEQATVLAARRLGIPVVVVVDLFAIAESGWLRDAAYGDAVCVLAPSVRQRLIDLGRPAQQVHVTGNPAFDRLADPELPTRARDLRRSRGWHDARVITWASQPEPSDPQLPRRIEQALIAGLEQHPAWHLVLRPHPSDAYALPTPGPRLTISTRADDLHTLLHASEAVVTMTSTVGLEAVLCGKPLITWDRSENTAGAPYAALGLSTGVADLDQLVPTIAAAVAAPRPVSGLPMVGQATALVANQVRRLIGLPALAAQVR